MKILTGEELESLEQFATFDCYGDTAHQICALVEEVKALRKQIDGCTSCQNEVIR